ncbi:hypothetical protein ACWDQL_23715 [Streptomyces olivaceus]
MIGNLESFHDEPAASRFPPPVNKLAGTGSPPVDSGRNVDEIYVLIRALANTPGDRAAVNRALDIVLDGLSPRRGV